MFDLTSVKRPEPPAPPTVYYLVADPCRRSGGGAWRTVAGFGFVIGVGVGLGLLLARLLVLV